MIAISWWVKAKPQWGKGWAADHVTISTDTLLTSRNEMTRWKDDQCDHSANCHNWQHTRARATPLTRARSSCQWGQVRALRCQWISAVIEWPSLRKPLRPRNETIASAKWMQIQCTILTLSNSNSIIGLTECLSEF